VSATEWLSPRSFALKIRSYPVPTGGGKGNPAWDFKYLINGYEVNRLYRFVMRASYLLFESAAQVAADTFRHRLAMGHRQLLARFAGPSVTALML
jgi:hypothetical protein